jgi:dihydrofolate reductase
MNKFGVSLFFSYLRGKIEQSKRMISIIAAVARNRAIGFENKLIYWLPNDLKRFKALTTGHTIVMGRNTYESLPKGALPNRRNVVLSRTTKVLPGCDVYPTLEAALNSCKEDEDVYIIGGARVYEQAMAIADRLCLTEVDDTPAAADAFFPDYSEGWRIDKKEAHPKDERHAYEYAFVDYVRE